ncbi:MAG TPA: phenylalanine--tRNA ligase subunit beta, partial [Desulfobulbaceae bacterium]|nr:phenylalanine--tRNA ligase subunit beta [Desulfobulbaceae bacterium]
MKFTLSWLSTFVSVDDLASDALAEKLTMLGLEVDAVTPLYQGLEKIITARVMEVGKHPNADRLTLCQVDTGEEIIPIVCGAPNVRQGLVTALARPGVRLPDGMKIKKAKVRGEQSLGMLCSARELGLSEDHSGIMELDDTLSIGLPLTKALDLADTMIEVDLTPNRPDCASVLGIAREVAGFTGRVLRLPVQNVPALDSSDVEFSVTVENPALCPRYAARKLTGVSIGPSPWWMQRQLLAVGMRPINNIVDITNFVMLEYGQPLHAFDFKKLRQGEIIVRCPRKGEKSFVTLDGNERMLADDTLMICDGEGPVAVAGVMGGMDSEVTEQTTEVLLESACFDPVSIRRTARRLNLPSEASYRFERGVDPNVTLLAMQRAVQLMVELAGAEVSRGGVDEYPGKKELLALELRPARVCDLLGIQLSSDEIAAYLRAINFEVTGTGDPALHVVVPSFRPDVEREIDLIEEIARLFGYNEIPTTMPSIDMAYPPRDELRELRMEVSSVCTGEGFYEAINYSFVDEKHLDHMGLAVDDQRRQVTRLLNPLTEEQAVMRTMLLPGLLENICRNINYQQPDIKLFEIGKIFIQQESGVQPLERYQLCAVCTGTRYPGSTPIHFSGQQADFLDIKGLVESIIDALYLQGSTCPLDFIPVTVGCQSYMEPVFAVSLVDGDKEIGRIGRIKKDVLSAMGIKQPVYFFECDLHLLQDLPRKQKQFVAIPRFPMVKRDIALLVPEQVPAGELLESIRSRRTEHVESVDIFDVYSGKPIEEGMKSVALSVTYRSRKKTLDDVTVDRIHEKIVNSLMA